MQPLKKRITAENGWKKKSQDFKNDPIFLENNFLRSVSVNQQHKSFWQYDERFAIFEKSSS